MTLKYKTYVDGAMKRASRRQVAEEKGPTAIVIRAQNGLPACQAGHAQPVVVCLGEDGYDKRTLQRMVNARQLRERVQSLGALGENGAPNEEAMSDKKRPVIADNLREELDGLLRELEERR